MERGSEVSFMEWAGSGVQRLAGRMIGAAPDVLARHGPWGAIGGGTTEPKPKAGVFASSEEKAEAVARLRVSLKAYKGRMRQPCGQQQIEDKAKRHEANLYAKAKGLKFSGPEAAAQRRLHYLSSVDRSCGTLDRALPASGSDEEIDGGALVRTMSVRSQQNKQYWELLDELRHLREFAYHLVHGPIKAKLELGAAQPPAAGDVAEQKLVKWQDVCTLLRRFLLLCNDHPTEYQYP